MHGMIYDELKSYVEARHGSETWKLLLRESGVGWPKLYLPIRSYSDEDALALVTTASRLTGAQASAILEDFGEYLVPSLLEMYGMLIKPEWRTLDLIEHTETTIHKVVRETSPGARPAELQCTRVSQEELLIIYSSQRRMCAVAKGIAKGIAKHYQEHVLITESNCMLQGSPTCAISVKLVGAASERNGNWPQWQR